MLSLCAPEAPTLRRMMPSREEIQAWVRAVLAWKGWTATEFARRAGVVPSTLNRFLNDPDATHSLSRKTIQLLERQAGLAFMEMPGAGRRPAGFAEADAAPFDGGSRDQLVDNAVRELIRGRNGIDAWVLRSRALETAGYLPGDILLIDLNARAVARDAVCAQIYDWSTGKAETVMRIYQPPYLVGASLDERFQKPLMVDDDVVAIKGVILTSMRARRSEIAA